MDWPSLFRSTRVKLKLSMAEMAHLLGVTRQTIWNVETGAKNPSAELISKVMELR